MVEAGGIEPPSEGLQHKAATCVVCVFESQTWSARRQAFHVPAPLCNPSAQEAKAAGCAHLCLTSVTDADERASAGRGCFKQPVRKNNRRHLLVFCLFYEGADLGMLLVPQLPPSNPLRPRGVFVSFRCVCGYGAYNYSIDARGSQTIRINASSIISQRIWPMRMCASWILGVL